jgi:hypothetical protein
MMNTNITFKENELKRAERLLSSNNMSVIQVGLAYLKSLHGTGSVKVRSEILVDAILYCINRNESEWALSEAVSSRLLWGMEYVTPEELLAAAVERGVKVSARDIIHFFDEDAMKKAFENEDAAATMVLGDISYLKYVPESMRLDARFWQKVAKFGGNFVSAKYANEWLEANKESLKTPQYEGDFYWGDTQIVGKGSNVKLYKLLGR